MSHSTDKGGAFSQPRGDGAGNETLDNDPTRKSSAPADENSKASGECALVDEIEQWSLHDGLLAGLLILAAFYTIYFTRSLLFPITLAVMLNLVFKPIVLRLERWRVPSSTGAALILLALGIILMAGVSALIEPANHWFSEIAQPGYFEGLLEKLEPVQKPLQELEEASKKIEEITDQVEEREPLKVQEAQPRLGYYVVNTTWGFVGGATITFVLLYFLLAGGDTFLLKLVELMPDWRDKRRIVKLSREIQTKISTYLFTISAINILLGCAIGIGLWAIGLSNPVLWGVMACLLNYIPFAGPAFGALIVFIIGLSDFHSLGHAVLAPLIYVGINILEANFITPAMLSRSVSLDPVMIILSIFFWGWLWGVGGILLAVPLLVVLKILFEHSDSLSPISRFLTNS